MTKPLQGNKYYAFDREIMGFMDGRAIVESRSWNDAYDLRSPYR